MTVQVSVTVWTILCFLALMLILDRLLFRPLLSFMDKRREKIDGARTARETAIREREETLRRREEDRLTAKKTAMQSAADALEALRRDNAARLAEKKRDNEQRLARQQDALKAESQAMLASLEPRTDILAAALEDKLRSWAYRSEEQTGAEAVAAPYAAEPLGDAAETNE